MKKIIISLVLVTLSFSAFADCDLEGKNESIQFEAVNQMAEGNITPYHFTTISDALAGALALLNDDKERCQLVKQNLLNIEKTLKDLQE